MGMMLKAAPIALWLAALFWGSACSFETSPISHSAQAGPSEPSGPSANAAEGGGAPAGQGAPGSATAEPPLSGSAAGGVGAGAGSDPTLGAAGAGAASDPAAMDPAPMSADDPGDPAGTASDDTSDPSTMMDDPASAADAQPDAGQSAGPGDVTATADAGTADAPSAPCGPFGMTVTVNQTIVVAAGQTYDGGCKRFVAGNGLIASANAAQTDVPLFRLEAGARLQNAVVDASASDGIHTYGDATLANVALRNISDDGLTIKEKGTVEVQGGSASNAQDAVFQINAPSTLRIAEFTARDAGKLIRQDGGTTFRVDVFIEQCVISGMSEAIFRTDSTTSHVTMTDTRYTAVGTDPFMGVAPRNITLSGNSAY